MPIPKKVEVTKESDTEVIIAPNTTGEVIENLPDGKQLKYTAQVKNTNTPETPNNIEAFDLNNDDDDDRVYFENTNTLEAFFGQLQDIMQSEAIKASIMRYPDNAGDNFNVPCFDAKSFNFLSFRTSDIFNFIPRIQAMNGNSGGRFNIRAYHPSGRMLNISLDDFVIENPERKETDPTPIQINSGQSDLLNGFAMIMQQFQQQAALDREIMLEAIKQMKPEKDRFTLLAERKLEQDLLNPQQKDDPVSTAVASMLTSVAVVEKMGEALGGLLSKNDAEKEVTMADRFLTPENTNALVNNGLAIVGKLVDTAANAVDKRGLAPNSPAANQTVDAPEYETINPQQPQPQQPQQPMEQGTQEDMIKEMLDELESDRPLDATNVFLTQTLPQKFPMQTQMIVTMCRANDSFDAVFDMIEKLIPPQIMERYEMPDPDNEGEFLFNELGLKVQGRLEEIYNLIRSQPQQ